MGWWVLGAIAIPQGRTVYGKRADLGEESEKHNLSRQIFSAIV
jgi:hypothetical protein